MNLNKGVTGNNLELIPSNEVQIVFKLSPSLFSQPCRFRRAVKSASFPPGEAKGACTNSPWYALTGILRTAVDPSGAMRRPQLCIKQLYAVGDGYTC